MTGSALISIVVPVYNEDTGLSPLFDMLSAIRSNQWGDRFEFVLVDDGSTDGSWQRMQAWAATEPRATLVRLAGNRGAHHAGRAGLEFAQGDAMIFIPGDLQERVDIVEASLKMWHDEGKKVVLMVPADGERSYGSWPERMSALLFYVILRFSSRVHTGETVRSTVKLMDRAVAASFVENAAIFSVRNTFVLRQGISYGLLPYKVHKRSTGASKWTTRKKALLMLDLLVDSSAWLLSPWRFAAATALLYCLLRIASVFADSWRQPLLAGAEVILVLGGLLVLSILGLHLSRVHQELRGKPAYIVAEVRRNQIAPREEAPAPEAGRDARRVEDLPDTATLK